MNDITAIPGHDPQKTLEGLEQTNSQLIQRLAGMGVGVDGASIVATRLDLLIDRLIPANERVHFEVDFHLKFSEMLQQITREVTFNTSGLVLPK